MPSQRIPNHIEGHLGYYSLAGETSISEGTAQASWASANVALSAADIIHQVEGSAFALCRPPGHPDTMHQKTNMAVIVLLIMPPSPSKNYAMMGPKK